MYIADTFNHAIRRASTSSGGVTTVAGSGTPGTADGVAAVAEFNFPQDVAEVSGDVYGVCTHCPMSAVMVAQRRKIYSTPPLCFVVLLQWRTPTTTASGTSTSTPERLPCPQLPGRAV